MLQEEKRLATVSIIRDLQETLHNPPMALEAFDNQAVEIIVTHNVQAMAEKLGEIRSNNERDAGYLGAYAHYIHKEGAWKKAYPTFGDFCTAETGRGYTTVLDLMNNYEWFCLKSGYDPKRFFRLTRKFGWTTMREMRAKNLKENVLEKVVEEIEAKGLTRDEVKAKLDRAQPAELGTPDEGETRAKEWKMVRFNLPLSEYARFMEAIEEIVQQESVKDLSQAVMWMVTKCWAKL